MIDKRNQAKVTQKTDGGSSGGKMLKKATPRTGTSSRAMAKKATPRSTRSTMSVATDAKRANASRPTSAKPSNGIGFTKKATPLSKKYERQ